MSDLFSSLCLSLASPASLVSWVVLIVTIKAQWRVRAASSTRLRVPLVFPTMDAAISWMFFTTQLRLRLPVSVLSIYLFSVLFVY